MCKETGVTLGPGKRVVIMPDQGGVAVALTERLQMAGVEVLTLEPDAGTDALANSIQSWLSAGPVHGVYWLPALDDEGRLADMTFDAWKDALGVRVKSLYGTMRALFDQVASAGNFSGCRYAARRTTRLRSSWGVGTARRSGNWLCQDLQAERPRKSNGQSRRFRSSSADAAEVAEILLKETLRTPARLRSATGAASVGLL